MRVVELSNHPGVLLQDAQRQRRAATGRELAQHEKDIAQHHDRVESLRGQRDQARAQRRWWAWLRLALAARSEARRAPRRPGIAAAPTREEESIKAGMTGEQIVAIQLGRALGDDWALLHGYLSQRGEIDYVLLGPRGLFAIEVKHRNATVHVHGDDWRYDKYDKYGNHREQGQFADGGGRSPSAQLNQAADELERFLRSRGQHVMVRRIVVLTHPRSRVGSTENLTVNLVAASTRTVITYVNGSRATLGAGQRAQLEDLIARDHRHREARRSAR
jgi:hypothetical protein